MTNVFNFYIGSDNEDVNLFRERLEEEQALQDELDSLDEEDAIAVDLTIDEDEDDEVVDNVFDVSEDVSVRLQVLEADIKILHDNIARVLNAFADIAEKSSKFPTF